MPNHWVSSSLALMLACAPGPQPVPSVVPVTSPAADAAVSLDSVLSSLSVRARIAQLVMPWMPGGYTGADDPAFARVLAWVDTLQVGGVIVSVGSPLDVAARLNTLQRRSRLPLLVASDLEAGTTFRLVGGTPFPTNMGIAATGREEDAYDMGRITALEARAVGIHLAFAPVADINSNALNPIINTRSFGEDPAQVSRLVSAEVRGMQDHGLLATAKHFPGHGDTEVDSHIALARLDAGWARLDSLELVPFRGAVAAGVAAIMSAHIAVPAIGGETRPATFSPLVLGGVLRDSLKFRGVVVTDALNMGAVLSLYGPGEAAVLALEAGADILLQPADPAITINAVEAAVRSGRLSAARIDQSVRRILELKRRAGLFGSHQVELDRVMLQVGTATSAGLARAIAARSIVLVEDRDSVLETVRQRRGRRAVVLFADDANPGAGTALVNELRARGDTLTVFRLTPASGPASYDSARMVLARPDPVSIVAVAIRASASRGTIQMPADLAALIDGTARSRRLVLVSLGSPYIRSQTPAVGSYLIGWAANPTTEWAVAGALTGAAIDGRLPASLPPSTPRGSGLSRAALAVPSGR